MMHRLILILVLFLLRVPICFGQYTYFNETYQGYENINAISLASFCYDNNYCVIVNTGTDTSEVTMLRFLDTYGNVLSQPFVDFDDYVVYEGRESAYQQKEDAILWAGAVDNGADGNTGYAMQIDMTAQITWAHLFSELSDENTKSQLSCIRSASSDDTYWIVGTLEHNTNADQYPEEFSTYIAHLNENGGTIEDWSFPTETSCFKTQEVFELDNGKLLMSGIRSINQYTDHFLLLFNPLTSQIEQEEIWGSEWIESNVILRKMPDGNFYCIYDLVIESDGEFVLPVEHKECWLAIVNTETLAFDWELQILLSDLTLDCRGFAVAGFEPAFNGGYVFCYGYAPFNLTEGYYQPNLVKLNAEFEIEWIKDYDIEVGYQIKSIVDITVAPDGGFLCTGFALVPNPGTNQRQWTFKTDACGEIEMSDCPAVSVSEYVIADHGIQISPNPFQIMLKAILPQNAIRVLISDATGRVVFEEKVFYPNQQWNLSGLSDGVYMMSVECENGIKVSQRIVKQ